MSSLVNVDGEFLLESTQFSMYDALFRYDVNTIHDTQAKKKGLRSI